MRKAEVYFDKLSDGLYLVTKKGAEEEFREVTKGVNVELDKDGNVIGIEILNASKFLSSFIKKLSLKRV